MKHYIIILALLYCCDMVFNLKGSYNSICFESPISYGIKVPVGRVILERCCPGYVERDKTCEPLCDPPCTNGTCVAPNHCECIYDLNYVSCNITVKCPAGYEGSDCDRRCTSGTYGENCESRCVCDHGDCDHVSGTCSCHEGWAGRTCSHACACENDGICDPVSGICSCLAGWTGERCEEVCPDGVWGRDCLIKCDCGEYSCNEKDGKCITSCDRGFYGRKCEKVCSCERSGFQSCHQLTGKCECRDGWIGDRCERICQCKDGHHDGCNRSTGKCNCKQGWYGETCNEECICENGTCDTSGRCNCNPGWQGETCNKTCDDGFYGEGCKEVCLDIGANENFLCHHVMGPTCKEGFTGEGCASFCPEGKFGIGCKSCTCVHAPSCNRFTGECDCDPGWYGINCDKECPHKTYGKKCNATCSDKCPKCRKSDGFCQCQPNWSGLHCTDYCPAEYYDEVTQRCTDTLAYSTSPLSGTYFSIYHYIGLVITLAVVVLLLIIVVVYRRRAKKSEAAKVSLFLRHNEETSKVYTDRYDEESSSVIYETIPNDVPETHTYNRLVHVPVDPAYLIPRNSTYQSAELAENNLYWKSRKLRPQQPPPPPPKTFNNLGAGERRNTKTAEMEMCTFPSAPSFQQSSINKHYPVIFRKEGGRRSDGRYSVRYTPPPSIQKKT